MSLDLMDRAWDALRRVVRAGSEGIELDDDIATSTAIRLSLDGLVAISPDGTNRQRLTVTARGAAAFRQRRAAA